MALSEFELKKIEKAVAAFLAKRRPPEHLRDKLDLGYRIAGQSVELFEIRPVWDNPAEKVELSVAKATYVKSTRTWKVYWQRADLKWHRYAPEPEARSIEAFLEIVDSDEYGAFFG